VTYDPVDSDTDGVVEADVDNESVTTERANNIPSVRDGASQTEIQSEVDWLDSRRGGGVYLTNGLYDGITSTIDLKRYVGLRGDGIEATRLELADGADTDLIRYDAPDEDYYFGFLHNLKLDGNKANNSSGNGVVIEQSASFDANDFHMSWLFVDHFAGVGIKISFAWGHKLAHILSERCDDVGINISGGSQCYLSDCFTAYHGTHGLQVNARRTHISLLTSRANGYHGVFIQDDNNELSNCISINNSQEVSGQSGFYLAGDNITASNCHAIDDQGTTTQSSGFTLRGDRCRLVGCQAFGNDTDIIIKSDSTESVIIGTRFDSITDNGTRTLINGRGTNAGDPTSTGQWNGNADYAETTDATIHDTANDNLYKARNGAWSQIGS
jgi:hypothetical protein